MAKLKSSWQAWDILPTIDKKHPENLLQVDEFLLILFFSFEI